MYISEGKNINSRTSLALGFLLALDHCLSVQARYIFPWRHIPLTSFTRPGQVSHMVLFYTSGKKDLKLHMKIYFNNRIHLLWPFDIFEKLQPSVFLAVACIESKACFRFVQLYHAILRVLLGLGLYGGLAPLLQLRFFGLRKAPRNNGIDVV